MTLSRPPLRMVRVYPGESAFLLNRGRFTLQSLTLLCRLPKIPCVGYYHDYGTVPPGQLVSAALDAFPRSNNCLGIILKTGKSDAGTKIEFLGLTAAFPIEGGLTIGELSLAPGKVRKLALFFRRSRAAGTASKARTQKLAGKLSFARTAIMGRFG